MGEPVGVREPNRESLEAMIDVDFSMSMYRKCLDRGGFIPSQDTLWSIQMLVSYGANPYSEEQLRNLVAR